MTKDKLSKLIYKKFESISKNFEKSIDDKLIFKGSDLFELKATHGFPLEVAIDTIFENNFLIDWTSFIDQARKNKWYDFQTYETICYALDESFLDKEFKQQVKLRLQAYIMKTLKNGPYYKEEDHG